jgi:hypothetical protein
MSEEQKLRDVLEVHGILGVLDYCIANPTDTLGAANTALVRGALTTVRRLIRDHGKPNAQLHTLLGALADGVTFARVVTMGEKCTVPPAQRLRIGQALDECGWRLQGAADASRKAALDE